MNIKKIIRLAALAALWLVLGIATLWAVAALAIDVRVLWLRRPLALLYALGILAAWIWVRRPWKLVVTVAGFAVVLGWWFTLKPSNERDWEPDVAVLPRAEIVGNKVTVYNIRNCDYRTETDYDVRHYDRTFDLDQLNTTELYIITWGSPGIAHTIGTFGFSNGDYLCFSIETRNEKGENYSAIKGLFRQFEITYVAADERDVIRLRTNYRQHEEVCLYQMKMTPEQGRVLFLDYLQRINDLDGHAEWYNAATDNCTLAIRHQRAAADRAPWNWRMLINGYLDELLYQRGTIDTNLPFAELKKQSNINARAKAADQAADFSQRIRVGLPGMNIDMPPVAKQESP